MHLSKKDLLLLKSQFENHYGFDGDFTPLVGEYDLNIRIDSSSGIYILKLMRPDCDPLFVDMQIKAMGHLKDSRVAAKIPHIIPTQSGQITTYMRIDDRPRLVWLISYIPGDMMHEIMPLAPCIYTNIGQTFAYVDHGLEGFDHPALDRDLKWDLLSADWAFDDLDMFKRAGQRRIMNHIEQNYQTNMMSIIHKLPKAVIHNDGNNMNLLVQSIGGQPHISGVVDFGDMARTARIAEPAIAAAYTMMFADDPIECASMILSAYHDIIPLEDREIDMFFPFIQLRWCTTAANAARSRRDNPGHDYLTISEDAAWNMLYQYYDVDLDVMGAHLQAYCQKTTLSPITLASELMAKREAYFGRNQRLSYDAPFMPVRGEKHWLYDEFGRKFLDAYNNVPHVGHSHLRIVEAITKQLKTLNTNSRYLTDVPLQLAEKILGLFPSSLNRCYFVNSGSEANEIALRIARAVSGARNLIVMQHAYHGNTTGCTDISPYKHHHPQIGGAPDWVYEVPQPDFYRGDFWETHPNDPEPYFKAFDEAVEKACANGGLSGFICECLPSVGGQIVLPDGYFKRVYQSVRQAGGICIADDVQTGLGRLGDYLWGFEQQDVVPDIVVLGKPLGNGFPLAAVITTTPIAEAFSQGPEFFTTFGGSSVSCVAGHAVLTALEEDGLQDNARRVGKLLQDGFHKLALKHDIIGDVRGMGFFWGLDIVKDRALREPATSWANNIKNELYRRHILIGTDGPYDNVLKIRPPMTFDQEAAEHLITILDDILTYSHFSADG